MRQELKKPKSGRKIFKFEQHYRLQKKKNKPHKWANI